MSERSSATWKKSEVASDSLISALFAGFVLLLFAGYLDLFPSIPYTALAAVLLAGSLGVLFWANWRADRRAQADNPLLSP